MSLLLAPQYVAGVAGGVAFADVTVTGNLAAYFYIGSDGILYEKVSPSGGLVAIGNWIAPQAGMSLYQCRATALDTNPPPGSYGTWLDLAQTWSWGWTLDTGSRFYNRFNVDPGGYDSVPSEVGSFLLEIARKSDGVVVASGNVTVDAEGY